MNEPREVYAKADPDHMDLDHEEGGNKFAQHLRGRIGGGNNIAEIILDLSGNVRLDYWGCSRIVDTCVDILKESKNRDCKVLTILTSLRYENKEQYAWLFFNKSRLKEESDNYSSYSELAVLVCGRFGVQFNLYKVPLKFCFEEERNGLGIPQVVLSSK